MQLSWALKMFYNLWATSSFLHMKIISKLESTVSHNQDQTQYADTQWDQKETMD